MRALGGGAGNRTRVRNTSSCRLFTGLVHLFYRPQDGSSDAKLYDLVTRSALRFTPSASASSVLRPVARRFPSVLFLGARTPFLTPRGREERCRCRWRLYVTWVLNWSLVHQCLQLQASVPRRSLVAPKLVGCLVNQVFKELQPPVARRLINIYHAQARKFTSGDRGVFQGEACWGWEAPFSPLDRANRPGSRRRRPSGCCPGSRRSSRGPWRPPSELRSDR